MISNFLQKIELGFKKIILTVFLFCSASVGYGQTYTYLYTGGTQTYVVPAGVTSMNVDVIGARGGGVNCAHTNWQSIGGCGGRVQATIAVTPGHTIQIVVGQKGSNTNGTAYGGGGKDNLYNTTWPGAGGGGGTSIIDLTTGVTLVVAGGGGGGGGDICPGSGGTGDVGGAGGGLVGRAGNSNICGVGQGGKGGSAVAGGAGGVCAPYTGTAGTFGVGANCVASSGEGSGGGGGGYYGGGSGAYGAGGGGGSSYTNPLYASAVVHTQGFNCTPGGGLNGDGKVIITVGCNAGSISGAGEVCTGTTTPLTDAVIGGTWTSGAPGIATVSATGVVSGISAGVATISYQVGLCYATFDITVTQMPTAILGGSAICPGGTTTFSDATVGGLWVSGSVAIDTVDATGDVYGMSVGTSTLSYQMSAVCYVTTTVTVNAAPAAIVGPSSVCAGSTTSVADAGGGTWSSSDITIATIVSTGSPTTVSGIAQGTATLTYAVTGPGCFVTAPMTVIGVPGPITGPLLLCSGVTATLTDAANGGTWSTDAPTIVTVGASTGLVTAGVTLGTADITYTTGCAPDAYAVVTVALSPTAISGVASMCAGSGTTLSDGVAGGVWTSSAPGIASIGAATGVVNGLSAGTATISYTTACGTPATLVVTVNVQPVAITGTMVLCNLSTVSLADATVGGTWSSLSPGTATVDAFGNVTGVSVGTAVISYAIGSCGVATTVTVNLEPAPITGTASLCNLSTIALTDATAGGTWTSVNTGVATIDGIGNVTGVSAGTSVISYTIGSCAATQVITVNVQPAPITGTLRLCNLATTNLTDATAGGTWTSVSPGIATVSGTGVVTGVSPGNSIISYAIGSCVATATVTVNVQPAAITGTLAFCNLSTTNLTDATAGGAWTSVSPGIATVSGTGVVTGVSPGNSIISYTIGSCVATATVTVNTQPAPITGTLTLCNLSTTNLTDATAGGAWTSVSPGVATVSGTGVVTGVSVGNSIISYTIGSCISTATVTVNVQPAAITGTLTLCNLSTTNLTDATAGGAWTSVSPGIATVSGTGVVTGVTPGNSIISYTIGSCAATATVTVNVQPAPITGTLALCNLSTTNLTDATAGGAWTSVSPGVATVSGTGVVTGVSVGNSVISYSIGSCAVTAIVTVNIQPAAITGTLTLCNLSTTNLTDATAGGAWTSVSPGIATVGGTGVVTGVSPGNSVISYTIGSCASTATVTVNMQPAAITGGTTICNSGTSLLGDLTGGGVWSSMTPSVATISGIGNVTAVSIGSSVISYTIGSCAATTTVNVITQPAFIAGTPSVCDLATTALTDATGGGAWTSLSPGIATIGGTGLVTGVSVGTSVISYTIGTCASSIIVTVNVQPAGITGVASFCNLSATTLTDATGGGTWSSVSPGVASVDAVGNVTGVSAGTSVISYSIGSCAATDIVTVNVQPAPITGTLTLCNLSATSLTDATAGGAWTSVSPGVATVSGTGLVTGVSVGNSIISYTIGSCTSTTTVTVNTQPAPISGLTSLCNLSTISLSDGTPGGTWTSTSPGIATVNAVGNVTGVSLGTTIISYTIGSCAATMVVTVTTLPGTILGTLTVCSGLTTSLSDAPGGGTWASSASGTASVITATGVVTGGTAGTATITYTIGTGCYATTTVTVNPLPLTITGTLSVCSGLTTSLTDATAGGTWSSSAPVTASVSGTGVVTGGIAGTATITYTLPTGCITTGIVTVNPLPASITGTLTVCVGLTTSLTDASAGGTWASSAPGTATISGTGVVTGIAAGTVTDTYTLLTGCMTTVVVTVNPLPAAITGAMTVCVGSLTSLTDASTPGTWSSASGLVSVGGGTGLVTGLSAGTAIVVYTLPTSCITTAIVTVNPLPAAIPGTLAVCVGSSVTLTDPTGGGVWSASNLNAAIGGGLVTGLNAGTDVITYTLPTTCYITAVETINPLPATITGTQLVCSGLTTSLTDASPGGTWSSSATGTATVGATGIVTGGATSGTATITYTLPTGCIAIAVVTVNPLPSPITGNQTVCIGLTTVLTDATPAGTWSSSNANATVVSGTVTGVTGGTSTITYTIPTGCIATAVVTINTLPIPIMGTLTVCSGLTTSLSDLPGGGTWGSGALATATVGSATGLVTGGGTAGTATITYTIGTGCTTTAVVTVNPLPTAILGTLTVCSGLTTSLSDATAGGTWSSSNPATAGISGAGLVTGGTAGAATITYTLGTGCIITAVVTVNPLPSAITGTPVVCVGFTTALTDVGGGTWTTSASATAIVSGTGVVTGEPTTGTATITYTLPTGCITTVMVTDNPLATAGVITGVFTVCATVSTDLTDATPGGVWTSSATSIAIVDGSGVVTGESAGTATITYAVTNSCGTATTSKIVTVNPQPYAGVILGTPVVCPGNTSLLSDLITGGTWSSGAPAVLSITPSGLITGLAYGTATISYETTNMCGNAYATVVASVNPSPNAGTIIGGTIVCPTTSLTLSDPSSGGGGTWISASPGIATVGSSSGVVTGVATGTAVITYSITNSCATATTATTVTVHPFPKPIMGDTTLCQDNNIFLSDSVSGGVWSSSNALVAAVAPVVGTFPTASVSGMSVGIAIISYVVAPGCFVDKTVTVNAIGAISASNLMCVGGTQTATDLPGGGTWSSGTPSVATVGPATGVINAVASGAAIISYMLGPGCFVSTTLTVNLLPENYYVTGGGSYCSGGPGIDVGLDGSDLGISYQLFIGATPLVTRAGTGDTLDFGLFIVPGDYTVIATNTVTGCSTLMGSSAVITLTMPAVPFVGINVDPGTLVCVGTTTTFDAVPVNGGPIPVFSWNVNGITAGTGSTYSYVPINGDVVTVKMTSDAACVSPDTAINSVTMATTTGITPSLSLTVAPSDSVCTGTPVVVVPVTSTGGVSPLFTWVKNGINEGTGSTYSFLPVDGDNVFCWMYSSLSCALLDSVHSSNNIVMTVSSIEVPVVSLTVLPGNRIAAGDTVTFVATVSGFTGSGLSYQWEVDGVPVAGATSQAFISSNFASYDTVVCSVTGYSTCGNATRDVSTIIIDTIATGIHTLQAGASDIRLIPNPNNGTFTVKGTLGNTFDEHVALEITDMLGQVVYKNEVKTSSGKLNESIQLGNRLANGVYLLTLKSDSENKVFHFVIEQ